MSRPPTVPPSLHRLHLDTYQRACERANAREIAAGRRPVPTLDVREAAYALRTAALRTRGRFVVPLTVKDDVADDRIPDGLRDALARPPSTGRTARRPE